jgi:antitoxin component YwqK of YwqJK toxin-antitoxin module
MKDFRLLITCLLSIITLSCSTKNEENLAKPKMKKLMRVNVSQPRFDYEKECNFTYNSDNRISEINETTTYNHNPNTIIIKFSYQNDTIVSANIYSNGNVVSTKELNYSNGNLDEIITYTTEGVEKSRNEYFYNSNKKVISFKQYQGTQLIAVAENIKYGIDENIAGVEGSNVSFEFDR